VWHAASDESHLSARVVHVGEDRHRVAVRSVLRILLVLL
jgi:hypothetical protein